MGIPSYFSYIVKNYPHILSKFVAKQRPIDNLYLDCNSIIYDVYHRLDATNKAAAKLNTKANTTTVVGETISQQIIIGTIEKIHEYIDLVAPRKTVYIAFDGVAPAAKIEQQRTRRYKSWYQAEVAKYIYNEPSNGAASAWTTLAITPGTNFMNELDREINVAFNKSNETKNSRTVIVSASNDAGEGEHKLFDYIRQNPDKHKNEITAIYGLDADLIVLSICHLSYAPNLLLLRESPHFHMENLEPNANYLLDIGHLNAAMDVHTHDYIVLTFLLGNDFLPHFPALNIRTGGMDKLLITYRTLFPCASYKKDNDNLSYLTKKDNNNNATINWDNMQRFISALSTKENDYMKEEHKLRGRREYAFPISTADERFKKFESTPTFERDIEKHIDPFKRGWQDRYYTSLFPKHYNCESNGGTSSSACGSNVVSSSPKSLLQEKVAHNLCEGLEWTLRYYTRGCPDWRWTYQYLYPPLLKDLNQYLLIKTPIIELCETHQPVSQLVQLCSVLPRAGLIYLPPALQQRLLNEYSHWYPTDCCFLWAYCRYFWETHVVMQHIDMGVLEKLIQSVKNTSKSV